MKQASGLAKAPADAVVKDIRRATRRHYSAEDKIRIVLEGLRGEESIAELCRREGITSSMYSGCSKEFLEAGKKRLAGAPPADPGQDRALAPHAHEPHPARALLPTWRSRGTGRRLCRARQPCSCSREPEQSHSG